MNLRELDSFKLADAVTFHDELNPKLWHNNQLRPEVKEQLILITEDFLSELGIPDVDVDDITVSGSNAAFSYTPHSDLDLHLLVDMSRYDDDIYKEFFNAKKALYNEAHDIKIHGVPVEVYVQDSREPVVSLGEYSVLQDKWLRIPTKRRANFDQTTTQAKYNTLKELIELALKSKNLKKVEKITRKIKQYRQAGLDKGGEFGPENLAYKALRSQGYITKLYDLRDKLHSEILTIETMYQDPTQMIEEEDEQKLPPKVYHVTPASNLDSIMKAGLRPQVGARSSQIPGEQSAIYCFPDKTSLEDAMMNWLGDEFDEDEELALLEIDTSNLTGEYTPNAEFEIAITSLIPPNRIKVLSSNLATITESDVNITPVEKTLPVTPYGNKERQFRGSIAEGFDQPYPLTWEKSEYGDVDALAKLPDGTPLSIMFNDEGDGTVQVEFYRNNSQEVTGEGDAMRVFATVLTAIQHYVQEYEPEKLKFSASKDNWAKQQQNSESRASLYDKLVQRYSKSWGYGASRSDKGDFVLYQLTRIKKKLATTESWEFAPAKIDSSLLQESIEEYFKKDGKYFPHRIHGAHQLIRHYDKIVESVETDVKDFWHQMASLDKRKEVNLKPGNSVSVIQCWTHLYDSIFELKGNLTPKEIVNVEYDDDGKVQYIEFKDGSSFPDKAFIDRNQGGNLDGIVTTFFPTKQTASHAITVLHLCVPAGWELSRKNLSEASGYIPSEKEKNDPRFKTALTVDVKPDAVKKNAKSFNWKTTRAGIPPTANPNGKF
jgi:hypothetical protein